MKSIDKDRRASGFLSENEVRAHKKALRSERNHSGGISVKQLPTEKDLWLNDLGILNLLSFEAKYVILQQEWTDVLKIGRYMTAEVRCIIEDKCDSLKKYKKILKGRTLLHQGKQVLSNDQIWDVIRNVKEPKSTREVGVYLSMTLWHGAEFELYKDR